MTKQATSIRLSDEAEQNIKTIRERWSYLADKTAAIEFALWVAANSYGYPGKSEPAPAARPARATKKEQAA